jgi:hypothetical protein
MIMAGRQYGEYTIGWICALSLEMAAAIAVLDERHPDLPTSQGDHSSYVLGRHIISLSPVCHRESTAPPLQRR